MEKYKIGLFGGSFDPPTKAHIHVAEELIRTGVLDEVQFVPAYISFHGKSYGATPEQRCEMLEEMIKESDYALMVQRFEIKNKLQSSTCDFVEKFLNSVITHNIEYYFIVGADNAKKIPKFRNGKKLMNSIPFIAVNRGDVKVENLEWCSNAPHQVVNIGDSHKDSSSSKIRESLKCMEEDGLPEQFFDWCSKNVYMYILNNELYGLEDKDDEDC